MIQISKFDGISKKIFSLFSLATTLLLMPNIVGAKCIIPTADLRTKEDTPPALIAYISKIDLKKKKIEVKDKSGKNFIVETNGLEWGHLVSGYGGAAEISEMQVGYELKIWQADCRPGIGNRIKPVFILFMKPSWYKN